MNTKTILPILGIVGLILVAIFAASFIQHNFFILPLAYGPAGSLSQLQDEVNANATYRAELEDYINKANMTLPSPQPIEILEKMAIEIMNGRDPYMVLLKDDLQESEDRIIEMFESGYLD
jgi:hypothetical protein